MATLKKTDNWRPFQDQLSLNAGQKYCRMENSAILSTFIKLSVVINTLFCLFLSDRFTQVSGYNVFAMEHYNYSAVPVALWPPNFVTIFRSP